MFENDADHNLNSFQPKLKQITLFLFCIFFLLPFYDLLAIFSFLDHFKRIDSYFQHFYHHVIA